MCFHLIQTFVEANTENHTLSLGVNFIAPIFHKCLCGQNELVNEHKVSQKYFLPQNQRKWSDIIIISFIYSYYAATLTNGSEHCKLPY